MSRMWFKCGQSHQAHEINAEIYFCDKCGNKFKQSDILKIQSDFFMIDFGSEESYKVQGNFFWK